MVSTDAVAPLTKAATGVSPELIEFAKQTGVPGFAGEKVKVQDVIPPVPTLTIPRTRLDEARIAAPVPQELITGWDVSEESKTPSIWKLLNASSGNGDPGVFPP